MRSGRKSEEEFVAFYKERWPTLVAALRWSVPQPEDANDAAQEAFARAFERWGQVREHPSPEGWVFATGFRIASGLRRRARTLETKLPLIEGDQRADPRVASVELEELLSLMTPRERAALLLRHYYGLSTRETAEVLHCREGTVKSLLHRGIERIQPMATGRSTA